MRERDLLFWQGVPFLFLYHHPVFRIDMTKRIGASSKDAIAPTLSTQLNQGQEGSLMKGEVRE
jgi:hypothetical protein